MEFVLFNDKNAEKLIELKLPAVSAATLLWQVGEFSKFN